MLLDIEELFCECGGATDELESGDFKCELCGKQYRYDDYKREWEVLT